MKPRGIGNRIQDLTLGLVLLAVGGVFLLAQQGILVLGPSWTWWTWWPLALVAFGIGHLFDRSASLFLATAEILQGILFLAITRHWWGLTWSQLAPLLFMTLGVAWIVDALFRRTRREEIASLEGDRS